MYWLFYSFHLILSLSLSLSYSLYFSILFSFCHIIFFLLQFIFPFNLLCFLSFFPWFVLVFVISSSISGWHNISHCSVIWPVCKTYTHTHTHTHTHTYIYIYIYIYVCVCVVWYFCEYFHTYLPSLIGPVSCSVVDKHYRLAMHIICTYKWGLSQSYAI